jgi:hypothetical protein
VTLMSKPKCTPGIVPYGADQTAYLIIDRPAGSGSVQEIEIERADIEAVIADFMAGHVGDPCRVIAFNTLEHWCEDISEQVALEIQSRCDIAGDRVPEDIRDFVEHYTASMTTKTSSRTADFSSHHAQRTTPLPA